MLGATPSITCTDPSSNNHNCMCTCTNSIKFTQPFSSFLAGGSGPTPVDCEAGKNESLKREQDLMDQLNAKQQEHLEREQELTTQLSEKEQGLLQCKQELSKELENRKSAFTFVGCYLNNNSGKGPLANGYTKDPVNTVEACEAKCRGYTYFALENTLYCTCGNSLQVQNAHVPDAECSAKCPGNSNQFCGASGKASLYIKRV